MRIVKSLILVVMLTGATYAGDMLQPVPPPIPLGITRPTTADKATEMLVAIVQNLLLVL
jgi:hypothetical protein